MEWSDDRSQPQARVLLDSISPAGHRLTSIEVTIHRFILAEFNTHRVFSRNSASSRAIPIAKQIQKLMDAPALPLEFGSNQSGMQAGPPLEGHDAWAAKQTWLDARNDAVRAAERLSELGAHKQVTNRLLEPFMWQTIIVSATSWEGYWQQRCSPLAQPEIRVAAEAMREAYDASDPVLCSPGLWHTPLVGAEDNDAIDATAAELGVDHEEIRKRVSAARCARVSYLTHDGKRDIGKDLELYDRLVTADPPHWSPLEHVATPCPQPVTGWSPESAMRNPYHEHAGNFTGWSQLRHRVEAERYRNG